MDKFIGSDYVVCRPALQKDTAQVMELCSHIWDGGDYIPMVWEEWLADPEGLLGVAESGGRVAGIFKLTKYQEKEWWMEGLRVHPDFQGIGVAAHIHNFVVETWRKLGSGVVRLATASYNIKVHHMCEQGGFKRIAEFIPYRAPAIQAEKQKFTQVNIDAAQKALDFVSLSPIYLLSARLVNLGWVYADLQLKHIQEAIGDKHAWWWCYPSGFISIWEDHEEDERQPAIQLIACSFDDLADLLVDYRRLMGSIGYKSAGWMAPKHPEVIACLEKTGFERTWDNSLYIYELRSTES
jgi:GNAT superfamily N-acetyltransferase